MEIASANPPFLASMPINIISLFLSDNWDQKYAKLQSS